jgi:hypothetical protein
LDYTTVGHVTVDVMPDGSRRAGGAAFYSALQAARLGLRVLIHTRGVAREIEELLAPYRGELQLEVEPAQATTTLATSGAGAQRVQRVLRWAGAIVEPPAEACSILHWAPVARELPPSMPSGERFTGLTPQGLAREWTGADAVIVQSAPSAASERLAASCDAIALSLVERESCTRLIERARSAGAVVAVTAGSAPALLFEGVGEARRVAVPPVPVACDDIGAGDVFAAALFVALEQGAQPTDAVAFANAAAAVRIQGDGAGAIGGRDAIEARAQSSGADASSRAS